MGIKEADLPVIAGNVQKNVRIFGIAETYTVDAVTALAQLVAAPSNLATTVRLMAGNELVTEGFKAGQVGSSAMPHFGQVPGPIWRTSGCMGQV